MLMVPVRVTGSSEGGVLCRLGSQPGDDAPQELIPAECIIQRSQAEGSDLAVLVLDQGRLPDRIKLLLGIT